jgi:hypothetical protein
MISGPLPMRNRDVHNASATCTDFEHNMTRLGNSSSSSLHIISLGTQEGQSEQNVIDEETSSSKGDRKRSRRGAAKPYHKVSTIVHCVPKITSSGSLLRES